MRSRFVYFISCWVAALFVSACGSLLELPGQGPGPQLYNLPAMESGTAEEEAGTLRLVVEEPDAPRGIDTDRVVLYPSPVEIKYYKDARWSDRAPRLVQTLLVESLDNTGSFEFVGREAAGVTTLYGLKGSLSAFHATYDGRRPTIRVKLKLSVIHRGKGQILAAKTFEGQSEARADAIRSVVLAFDEATTQVLQQAVTWTLDVLKAEQIPVDTMEEIAEAEEVAEAPEN